MIKKSVFENDLIVGMQRELRAHDEKQGMENLVKAAEYLHATVEIFEEAGLTAKADQVLKILAKIAAQHHKKAAPPSFTQAGEMPSIEDWAAQGVTVKDMRDFTKNPIAKAKLNNALRQMGYTDSQMAKLLGHHNVLNMKETDELLDPERSFGKMWDWMQNPHKPTEGETINPGQDITFKSIADDKHISGLTSEKMLENLKNHGMVFNMADDGADLLNADIADEPLEVIEGDGSYDKTFEDSD
jgi:hypothetical protein